MVKTYLSSLSELSDCVDMLEDVFQEDRAEPMRDVD
jgi:hypothetical protein